MYKMTREFMDKYISRKHALTFDEWWTDWSAQCLAEFPTTLHATLKEAMQLSWIHGGAQDR